ncbi:MAG: hypothetical protein ACI8P7_000212 [Candidatus Azotimanducaceae bacterium]|jgi:hypothetical protein
MKNSILIFVLALVSSCHFLRKPSTTTNCNTSKFDFDINAIDAKGRYLENNNSSYLHYEFCLPQNSECLKQIKRINSKLKPLKSSALLKCGKQSILMSGTSYQDPNPKQTLCELAELACIKSISKSPFE